ncbi:hypothetical protein BUALT_Bualt15G0080700 [Buddleja alternifolia]|uniref:DUF7036 domain-containing protein n=1 Tax=Buddleja alternifolia TaxID=168488 RepID=A0AAV6WE35_9LAMI|nr:hypothetical protein BUALT_Bualt15G0080700 [Buddleja alternifolia]
MGKADNQRLPVVQQQQQPHGSRASRTFLCRRCSMGVFSLKCAVVLIFSIAAFLSALYLVLPVRYKQAAFDVKDSIKISGLQTGCFMNKSNHRIADGFTFRVLILELVRIALHVFSYMDILIGSSQDCVLLPPVSILLATVQAYFKIQKPVSKLVPYIARLEYDINDEIGVPSLKVAVLSMHAARLSNLTDVVFGFLPDSINSTMNQVALSVLKSSLVDLFLHESNLTLTSSIFGEPTSFEILKFPGGITIIPERTAFILQIPQSLFNFTLNSSMYDIKQNLPELKEQLKLGLHLMSNEVLYIQVTNKHGSTKDPPVTVEASVASDVGSLLPERLRQLAQIITRSPPTENLGLDHSVFGKVKEISLSSFLNHSLHATPPTSSPSPSPIYDTGPSMAPSVSPAFSPNSHNSLPPSSNCYSSEPSRAPTVAQGSLHSGSADPPSPSPTSLIDQISPNLSPHASNESPLAGSTPQISPGLSPSPGVVYGSRGTGKGLVSPPNVLSSSALARSLKTSGSSLMLSFYSRHLEESFNWTADISSSLLDILNDIFVQPGLVLEGSCGFAGGLISPASIQWSRKT